MIKITIIAVGKIKEKYWQASIDEYIKRLGPYSKLSIIDLPEEKVSNISNRKSIIKKEAQKIIKSIPKEAKVILVDMRGKNFTSEDFSLKISEWSQFGKEICFIIGGPLGLSSEVYTISDQKLALSKMTFTHQLTKVILMEQIYRSMMIQIGKTYHY